MMPALVAKGDTDVGSRDATASPAMKMLRKTANVRQLHFPAVVAPPRGMATLHDKETPL